VNPTKRISVLLPVYNGAETVNLAIRSTLKAMGRNDELLVLIQGSNLDSYQIGEISDSRLQLFYEERGQGIAKALNILGLKASGEFIARMDQDDICLRSRFKKQIRAMHKHKSDFVFSNAVLFGKQIRPFGVIPQLQFGLKPRVSNLMLPLHNPFIHPTMLARRSVLEQLNYYRESVAEDYDLWIRAASQGYKLRRIRSYGLLYRVHGQQYSQGENFQKRVNQDDYISESKVQLINFLIKSGELDQRVDIEAEIKSRLKQSDAISRILYSRPGRLLSRIANKLLGKNR
jgi:glycosyltransferase involved in cell wall biosynthesis